MSLAGKIGQPAMVGPEPGGELDHAVGVGCAGATLAVTGAAVIGNGVATSVGIPVGDGVSVISGLASPGWIVGCGPLKTAVGERLGVEATVSFPDVADAALASDSPSAMTLATLVANLDRPSAVMWS